VAIPQAGAILIRDSSGNGGFALLDAITLHHVAGPFPDYAKAIAAARANGRPIWQQNVDHQGRPLGEPFRLPLRD
jgi:hypothetical protein